MRDTALKVPEKRARLAELWPQFTQAMVESPYLVRPDRELIAKSTSDDLNARLKAMETTNPFETRGWGGKQVITVNRKNSTWLTCPIRSLLPMPKAGAQLKLH